MGVRVRAPAHAMCAGGMWMRSRGLVSASGGRQKRGGVIVNRETKQAAVRQIGEFLWVCALMTCAMVIALVGVFVSAKLGR